VRLLQWSSVGLVIGASSAIHANLFTKAMDFRQPVIRGLIANATGGAVGVGMALAGCGVWSLVGQQLAGAMAGTIFLWRMSSYRPAFRFSWPHLRQLFGFSSSVFATSIFWYFSSRLDQMVIGRFSGIPMLGLYTIAGKIPNLANMVTQQPLAAVSLPSLSKLQGDQSKMRQMIVHGMELNAVVSFAIFVGVAALSSDLVPLLFGAKWVGASLFCSMLSIYALINVLQVFVHPALLASGGVGKYVLINVWHITGVVLACLVGVQFGVTYLIFGLILNHLIITIPALLFLQQRIGMSPLSYCRPCLVPAMASLFMVCVVWLIAALWPHPGLPAVLLACKVTAGAVAYLSVVFVWRRGTFYKLFDMAGRAVGSFSSSTMTIAPPVVDH